MADPGIHETGRVVDIDGIQLSVGTDGEVIALGQPSRNFRWRLDTIQTRDLIGFIEDALIDAEAVKATGQEGA